MNKKIKNKIQNWGSHLKNIHGSPFRKAWISAWLDDEKNKGKHYKDAVKAYIDYKTKIAKRWAEPVELLLENKEPCDEYGDYSNLLKASKDNVAAVAKALTTTMNDDISYTGLENKEWTPKTTKGWMKETDKYYKKLQKPSGKTRKWIEKLQTLCADFQNIESEAGIVPGLAKIIEHCTYDDGDPTSEDYLPLYMYPDVHLLYTRIANILKKYSNFVTEEINNGHKNQKK